MCGKQETIDDVKNLLVKSFVAFVVEHNFREPYAAQAYEIYNRLYPNGELEVWNTLKDEVNAEQSVIYDIKESTPEDADAFILALLMLGALADISEPAQYLN